MPPPPHDYTGQKSPCLIGLTELLKQKRARTYGDTEKPGIGGGYPWCGRKTGILPKRILMPFRMRGTRDMLKLAVTYPWWDLNKLFTNLKMLI